MSRLKHLLRLNYGDALAADKREEGEIPVFGSNGPVGTHSVANTSAPTILVGRKGSFGKVVWSDLPGFCIDTAYYVDERSCAGDLRFSFYALQSLGLDTTSRDTGVPGLSREDAHDRRLAIPSREEQTAIARFLDRETTRIDGLIEKKGRFIELLKEKRAALITHAVTKGIDAGVPMKDSGHAWLGQIPEHWDTVPPTALFTESKERAHEGDQMLSATQKYGVIPLAEFEELEQRQVTMAVVNLDKRKHTEIGDFVISMRSMDGGLERARAVGSVRSSYSVLKCGPEVEGLFFGYLLKSSLYIQALRLTTSFIRDGQDMNFSHFRKVRLPLIPVDEQARIASHIDRETARVDGLIAKTDRSIELLKEKRSALITAAVTGKIDVRNAA